MKWIEFSRLMQAVEYKTPNRTVSLLAKEFEEIEYKKVFIEILSLDLGPNNLASKKALKWITKSLEVFEEEVEVSIYNHGDIGEGIYHFDTIDESSDLSLGGIYSILQMDCGKSDGEAFRIFNTYFNEMSSLERKWFLRYWLRTPRNGINEGLVRKMVAKVYDKKEAEVRKHMQLHSLSDIVVYYTSGETPPNDLVIGRFIKPMLAKAVPKEQWPKESIIEYKYDGARYQIHYASSAFTSVTDIYSVLIFNRKGKRVTDKFPDVVEEVRSWKIKEPFIIDTEIYPIENDGRPAPFKKMGTRIHSKNIEDAVEKCPVELGIFDCMMFNGENLMDNSLRERLPFILKFPKQAVRVTEDNDAFYNLAINDGYEGIMVKDLNATYHSGKRSVAWAKYKPPRIELDVVVTGARYGEGKRATVFGSYDIAVKEENNFIPVGSVGTGFSDIDLISLTNEGKKIIQRVENGTYELLPRIVLEVTADLVTRDANDNLGLRFPRLLRIRTDKPVSDINTIQDVEGMI
tara:strand:- start:15839 stop:17389 length:1551 start_codon:yes stop_codon:yes gene_type:complete